MKTIIQIFAITLCLAILGQSYLQAFAPENFRLESLYHI